MRPYRVPDELPEFRSAREQMADVSLLDETETYLNIDGLLYSFVSLKDLPDATFPGILRELAALDFPIVVNAQVTIPDQAKALKSYKSRMRKMQSAQRDTHGGFRVNVEAQVAEAQLLRVQQDIIASSVKTAKLSLIVATRTSRPAVTMNDLEQAERLLSDRCQQVLHAVARMNALEAEGMVKDFTPSRDGSPQASDREHVKQSQTEKGAVPCPQGILQGRFCESARDGRFACYFIQLPQRLAANSLRAVVGKPHRTAGNVLQTAENLPNLAGFLHTLAGWAERTRNPHRLRCAARS